MLCLDQMMQVSGGSATAAARSDALGFSMLAGTDKKLGGKSQLAFAVPLQEACGTECCRSSTFFSKLSLGRYRLANRLFWRSIYRCAAGIIRSAEAVGEGLMFRGRNAGKVALEFSLQRPD